MITFVHVLIRKSHTLHIFAEIQKISSIISDSPVAIANKLSRGRLPAIFNFEPLDAEISALEPW